MTVSPVDPPSMPSMSSLDSLKAFLDSCVTNLVGEKVPNPALDYGEVAIKGAAVLDVINTRNKLLEELSNPDPDSNKIDNLQNELSAKGETAQRINEIKFNPLSNFIDWFLTGFASPPAL